MDDHMMFTDNKQFKKQSRKITEGSKIMWHKIQEAECIFQAFDFHPFTISQALEACCVPEL